MTPPLLSVAEAHARLLALVAPLPTEVVALADAAGRVLADPVSALRDQPPFAASAMDGYAVRAADVAAGARLRVVGTVPAGARFSGRVGTGEAVRIFTGAPVPEGADFVLIQEDTLRDGDGIRVAAEHGVSPAIRPAGGDFRRGDRLTAPRRLGPAEIALAAAMGAGRLTVARRPEVALLCTGDELVPAGEPAGPDRITSSNGPGLKALLDAAGARTRLLPIARDTAESLSTALALAAGADLVVTVGGASVGDFDLVRQTAAGAGLDLDFHRIAMRPGKPLLAGRLRDTPLVGLPGNPVSAFVTARVFLVPMLERTMGLPGDAPRRLHAQLGAPIEANGERTHFVRARVEAMPEGWLCTPFPNQDSSLLSILAEANALLVRPPDDPPRDLGDPVEFIWLKLNH